MTSRPLWTATQTYGGALILGVAKLCRNQQLLLKLAMNLRLLLFSMEQLMSHLKQKSLPLSSAVVTTIISVGEESIVVRGLRVALLVLISRGCGEGPHEPCSCQQWHEWLKEVVDMKKKIGMY